MFHALIRACGIYTVTPRLLCLVQRLVGAGEQIKKPIRVRVERRDSDTGCDMNIRLRVASGFIRARHAKERGFERRANPLRDNPGALRRGFREQ